MNPLPQLSNNAKFRLTLILFCGVAVGVSLWPGDSIRQSVLEYGALVSADDEDEAAGERAKAKILGFGTRAGPTLVQMLEAEPTKLDRLLEKVAEWGNDRWGWEYNPGERIDRERHAALAAIAVLGTNAIVTLPALERLFWEPARSESVSWALAAMGKPALSIFVSGLTNSAEGVRRGAVFGLAKLGSEASSAYPALHPLFADPDLRVRSKVGYAAGRMASSLTNLVSDLAPLMHDSEAQVRGGVAHGLGMAAMWRRADEPGMADAAALVALGLSDPDKEVRHWSAWMMMHFKAAATPHLPALLRLLEDPDEHVRRVTTATLGHLGLGSATVIPALAARLATTTGNTRTWTAVALRGFGDEVEKVQPGLLGTLGKKEFEAQAEHWRKLEQARKP